MNNNVYHDFKSYAKSEGIGSLVLDQYGMKIENSLTPYVLEERQLNVTQIDVFSRLLMERIIWIGGEVDDHMSTIVQAQLMFLDSVDHNDIRLHIDTPGGSVKSGLSMIDVMDYVHSDIVTVNTGIAASMGSLLLGAGTKGKRASLRFSKTMIHQSSGGFSGKFTDAKINMEEWGKYNKIIFELLGQYCGKDPIEVEAEAEKDKWFTAEEALKYGIIDEVVIKKKK